MASVLGWEGGAGVGGGRLMGRGVRVDLAAFTEP